MRASGGGSEPKILNMKGRVEKGQPVRWGWGRHWEVRCPGNQERKEFSGKME